MSHMTVPFGQDPSKVYDEQHGYSATKEQEGQGGAGVADPAKTGGDSNPVVDGPTPFKNLKGAKGG